MNNIPHANITRFLDENYPDLLAQAREDDSIQYSIQVIIQQIQTDAETEFFKLLAEQLGVSKYRYLLAILEEDFETEIESMRDNGVIKYEVINIIQQCEEVFESIPLTKDSEEDRLLRYAVMGVISDYLYKSSVA